MIDGRLDSVVGEWADADIADIDVKVPEGGTTPGRIYEMNDADNLYLAVRYENRTDEYRAGSFEFDNDHDAVPQEEGDDVIVSNSFYGFFDDYRTSLPPCPPGQSGCGLLDTDGGGTSDGAAATANNGTYTVYEFSHPLNSADDAHDFSLAPGDTVGFQLVLNQVGREQTSINDGDIVVLPIPDRDERPVSDAGGPYETVEGSPVLFDASRSTDPDEDSLTYRWDFQADGTWDTPSSPNPTATYTWGDDWTGTARVEVSDGNLTDDDEAPVIVTNVVPSVDAGADAATDEGSPISFAFAFQDPGFDQPAAGTVEDFTASVGWGYGALEALAVSEVPGSPGTPTVGAVSAMHPYGDDGAFTVTITVCDDDGGCGSDSIVVTVRNADPEILETQVYVRADLRLRVAGEKWHDVRMDLTWNGGVTGTTRVVRTPGSPDDQSATVGGARLQLLGDFRVTVYYTPDDDPVNGQGNGATPVWVILVLPDGSEVPLHHTFNVQHPDTWTWVLDDVRPYLASQETTFEVHGSDVGSDDLTIVWEFGDGGVASVTYFNDGVGPDPFPSPEVNPISTTDVATHAYASTGTYLVILRVTDDDGGTAVATFALRIGG